MYVCMYIISYMKDVNPFPHPTSWYSLGFEYVVFD